MEWTLIILAFAGGYVAAIYTWPWLRTQMVGAANEAVNLRQRAIELENRLRGRP